MDDSLEVKGGVSPGSDPSPVSKPVKLRILALAEFARGAQGAPISISKSTFGEVLARLAPRVSARVPDRLGTGKGELAADLCFAALESFSPSALADAVAPLADLLAGRRLVEAALRGGLAPSDLATLLPAAFRDAGIGRQLAATPARGPAVQPLGTAPTGDIDALLSQVDVPTGAASPLASASLVDVLTAALVPSTGTTAAERARMRTGLSEIDARLTRQTSALCELKEVRDLEAVWRGLKFLVDRIDFRGRISLEILSTTRDRLLEDFYEKVFKPEYDGLAEDPLTLVVADFAIDRGPSDLEMLQNAARMASSLRVPFVFAGAPEFFGVRQPGLLATLPDLVQKMRSQEYAKWNRFRQEESALWVVLTANRVLLRDAWGGPGTPVREFAWDARAGESGGQPLWGSGVWALAAAVAQGFAAEGPRFPLAGPQPPALLENLPLRPYRAGKSEPVPYPLEVMLPDKRAWELAECGFAPLVAQAGRDAAFFASTPTFSAPRRYDREEATRASFLAATLPYQLFAGVAGARVERIGREIRRDLPPDRVAAAFAGQMLAFLSECGEKPDPEEVRVEVSPSTDSPAAVEVVVRLSPRFKIYGGDVDLVLGTIVAG